MEESQKSLEELPRICLAKKDFPKSSRLKNSCTLMYNPQIHESVRIVRIFLNLELLTRIVAISDCVYFVCFLERVASALILFHTSSAKVHAYCLESEESYTCLPLVDL